MDMEIARLIGLSWMLIPDGGRFAACANAQPGFGLRTPSPGASMSSLPALNWSATLFDDATACN
jgi:hypothetical protein